MMTFNYNNPIHNLSPVVLGDVTSVQIEVIYDSNLPKKGLFTIIIYKTYILNIYTNIKTYIRHMPINIRYN